MINKAKKLLGEAGTLNYFRFSAMYLTVLLMAACVSAFIAFTSGVRGGEQFYGMVGCIIGSLTLCVVLFIMHKKYTSTDRRGILKRPLCLGVAWVTGATILLVSIIIIMLLAQITFVYTGILLVSNVIFNLHIYLFIKYTSYKFSERVVIIAFAVMTGLTTFIILIRAHFLWLISLLFSLLFR